MTKLCPRCKEPRLIEWFGERNAPYAICLSCRVELNGEKSIKRQEKALSPQCVVCSALIFADHQICIKCENGIKAFDSSAKLLSRAAAFVGGNLRSAKQKVPKIRKKKRRLEKLVQQQRRDATDRNMRFEHSVNK